MKLDVLPSRFSYTAEDEENLRKLLDDFGSMDLKDISAAYCQAGRDTCAAAKLLRKGKGIFVESSKSESEDGLRSESDSSYGSSDNHLGKDLIANRKVKKCPASMGSIAGVIGKEYVKPKPEMNGSRKKYKPLKLYSDEIPETEIWDEKQEIGSISRIETMRHDVVGLLYEVLGKGFQLDMELIQDVVGQCGYDFQMSFDKILEMSAATLGNSVDVVSVASGSNTEKSNGLESTSFGRSNTTIQTQTQGGLNLSPGKKTETMQNEILHSLFKTETMQNEILHSLFESDIFEEKQEITRPVRQPRNLPHGRVVSKPMQDIIIPDFTFINRERVNTDNEANEDTYDDIRKALLEYWTMMKDYYKAAVDAFANKDDEKGKRFLKEGRFYMMKAREADEKSTEKLLKDSDEEVLTVNLYHLDPKDALSHLKRHLASYCGFNSFRLLKAVAGTDGRDTKDGRRKRLICKLLEKEEIPWTEDDSGWTISIRVDKVDPKKLSFVKK